MMRYKLIIINRKILMLGLVIAACSFLLPFFIEHSLNRSENVFMDAENGIVVIDPGHGGIDGGTNKDGILEKDANLDISLKLRTFLEASGYTVVMTRDTDVALDKLDTGSGNRHQRDLNARARIINNSNAQFFLSIHVNCNFKKPSTEGAIVFYNNKFSANKELAHCIQNSLNQMVVNDKKRTIHEPASGEYFLLRYAKIPGVIVETAFMSNTADRQLITTEDFKEKVARAIFEGVEDYLEKPMIKIK